MTTGPRMNTALLVLLAAPQQAVVPRAVEMAELRRLFPERQEFPETCERGRALPSATFESRLERLVREPLLPARDGRPALHLGDLVREGQACGWDMEALAPTLARLEGALTVTERAIVRDLLDAGAIGGRKWKPSKTKADGIAEGPTWEMDEGSWLRHDGSTEVEQGAILILADIATIKAAEHDFPRYFSFPDNRYEKVAPIPGRHLTVSEDGKRTASLAEISFRTDLPFPFGDLEFDLGILHRKRDSEDLVTYVFAKGDDMHWLAGRDRFLTVRDRDGQPVATLIARQLGSDVDGVPEKSKHRREGLRAGLGNLRRGAEARFDGNWQEATEVPDFPVIAPSGR